MVTTIQAKEPTLTSRKTAEQARSDRVEAKRRCGCAIGPGDQDGCWL
jgi:hypothetical protein